MPISRLLAKKEKENVSLIALIDDISETKNGNVIITAEDLTGRIKVVFSKNKKNSAKFFLHLSNQLTSNLS